MSAVEQALRDRIAALEDALGMRDADFFPLRMGRMMRIIFGLLLKRAQVRHAQIDAALYGGLPDCDRPPTAAKAIHVHLHHLRRRLAPHGIEIVNLTSAPFEAVYRLPPDSRQRARAMIAPAQSEAA